MVVTGAPQVYSFTVQDKDAEALTYGCVANLWSMPRNSLRSRACGN